MKQNFALCLVVLSILSFSFLACSDDQEAPTGTSSGAASDSSQSPASSSSNSPSSSTSSSSPSSSSPEATLYISEYVEGSGNNKYIELYNPGSSAVNLSGWILKKFLNGALTASSSLNLTGTIPPAGCFVVRREPAGTWSGTANQSDSQQTMDYNGDDPIGLFNGSTLIDLVGTPGDTSKHLENMTLIRKPGRGAVRHV